MVVTSREGDSFPGIHTYACNYLCEEISLI